MIIESLLENDFYKFTMQQAVFHHLPNTHVVVKFKCRQKGVGLTHLKDQIESELDFLCGLKFSKDELFYLKTISFLKKDYIDFLSNLSLDRNAIKVNIDNNQLDIVVEGNWCDVILFEIPVLAIVNELYFRDKILRIEKEENDTTLHDYYHNIGLERLYKKIELIQETEDIEQLNFKFADFGLRRRFSRKLHDNIISILKTKIPKNLIGTSNVYLAQKHQLTPIGTMAHEWVMCGQGLDISLKDSQKYMLELWIKEYPKGLGIALSDTLGFDSFLKDFSYSLSHHFEGCRHDSGDPFLWGEKLIEHYEHLGIDPKTKTAVFSDNLNFPLALKLANHFNGWINTSFGIGTNLTNDVGFTPLQIVMKIVEMNGKPVAKISDSPGKCMCENPEHITKLKELFSIK